MKLTRLAFCAALATSLFGSFADAQTRNVRATSHRSTVYSNYYAQTPSDVVKADESAPAPIVQGETQQAVKVDPSMSYIAPAACSSSCDIGTGNISCDDACDAAGSDPWKLFQCPVLASNIGGWTNVGYHTRQQQPELQQLR